jgi:hypothetical protein
MAQQKWLKPGFIMLKIAWKGPRVPHTVLFIGHAYRLYPLQAI